LNLKLLQFSRIFHLTSS